MAGVVEITDPKSMSRGIVLNFPANDDDTASSFNSLKNPPRRLRRRLLSELKSPLSAELIQAKLREADLRRQQFYEILAGKAKPKSRNSLDISSREENRRQLLEARLDAAEQKRLGILNSAQMRLARLDQMRKAAKSGAERRFEEERKALSTKIESRIKRAEARRILLLKAYKQRKAAKREQAIRSLRQKICKKDKYRASVRDAIYLKHAVAERNRHGLLGEKKIRAHTTALQVQEIARSVYSQQETQRKDIKDQIEYQLKMAKRKREEYLRRRRSLKCHLPANLKIVDKQEYSSRKIARHWRHFVKSRKTTLSFVKAYASLGINENSVKLMPFEQLAILIKSEKTVSTVKALMNRLEFRLKLSLATSDKLSKLTNIDDLLRHIAFPHHNRNFGITTQGEIITATSVKKEACTAEKFSRYPARAVLSAYMIMGHPDAVLNRQGECENVLSGSAVNFIRQFELLVCRIIDGPVQTSLEKTASEIPKQKSIRSQLEAYDEAWCSYLQNFVAWKLNDAKLLEEDLVRAACHLELSMIQTSKKTSVDDGGLSHGVEALRKKVADEHKLLREQVLHVAGSAGVDHMEHAVSDMRSNFIDGKEPGSSFKATVHVSPSSIPDRLERPHVPISAGTDYLAEGCQVPNSAICSSYMIDNSSSIKGFNLFPPQSIRGNGLSSDRMKFSENELLVNEIIHSRHQEFADSLSVEAKDHYDVKENLREKMEKAFWDGVMESIKQDEPDFSWILKLMKEVRDELCEMSPQNWKQEIIETIDVDNLSQVLESGTLYIDCLGKNLAFALDIMEKLSAPVNDKEIKSSHAKLLRELGEISKSGDMSNASFSMKVIKGLRFVLEEIRALKKEISKARFKFVEPLIKGPAGVEYLQKSFTNRYGPPSDAQSSLKSTSNWLSSVLPHAEQEWSEYTDSLSAVPNNTDTSQMLPTSLRTGGTFSPVSQHMYPVTGSNHLECKGERVDKLVRLGLLKLASGVRGLTVEALPETLELNLSRLRAVQSEYQKAIVISTCMLILRQMLVSEKLLSNTSDIENIVSECHKKLSIILDSVEDIGISEIIGTIFGLLKGHTQMIDAEKLQGKEKVMESMLGKSLQGEDAVFKRVSHCVYLAFRAAIFGGNGYKGRQLVVPFLQRVGASFLADRVLKAAEILVAVAMVSRSVHGEWYEELLKSM